MLIYLAGRKLALEQRPKRIVQYASIPDDGCAAIRHDLGKHRLPIATAQAVEQRQ
ncbi:hypothetical protein [Burkholderia gladioli]|uniref:hypothetical protein n=1 Tax=Burkholderia gladioli TaxID=28095 RepID=UPI001640BEFF|nr:hypothetical protein [Burkholderia gladioli]MDN7604403.1 hypothetical protein [Burkholderia gladioli]